jgi:hypothetical protein
MQREYLLRAAMILLLIAGSYLLLRSATSNHPKTESCPESMEECCEMKEDKSSPGESLIETFSRQFISTSAFIY